MTGWSWEEAGEMTIPRFERLARAWGKIGPLAPYLPATHASSSPAASLPSAAPPAPTADPRTDPLGYLMAHPEML